MTEKTLKLKTRGDAFGKMFINRIFIQQSEMSGKELRAAETTEKKRPENQGCTSRLDARKIKWYSNGVVIY